MRYAIMKDGKVQNTIKLANPNDWACPDGCELVPDPDGTLSAEHANTAKSKVSTEAVKITGQ